MGGLINGMNYIQKNLNFLSSSYDLLRSIDNQSTTLEWMVGSPPPFHTFNEELPLVKEKLNEFIKKTKKKELKKLFGNKQLNTKFKVGDIIVIKRIGLLTYKKNKQTIIGICIKKTLKTNSKFIFCFTL